MHRSDETRRERAHGARPARGGWVDGAPPVTADDITTAADAGWAEAPPVATGSWVRAAGAYADPAPQPELSEPALAAGVAPAPLRGADAVEDRAVWWDVTGGRDDVRDSGATAWNEFDDAARHAAMARHPAFRNQAPNPAERPSAPAAPADGADGADAPAGELLERLERGLARVGDEAQLRSLAARAFARLVPDGSVTWLAGDEHGRVTTWAATGTGHPEGACRVQLAGSCPAASTGATQVFDRSDELDACPHLVDDDRAACAATCIPAAGGAVLLVRTPYGRPCRPAVVTYVGRAAAALTARAEALRAGR